VSWTPQSWQSRPAAQMPNYPDADMLHLVESCLVSAAPLTSIADSAHLTAQLGQVSAGNAFLLQGGDCAETFAEFGADKVRMTFNLLLEMAAILRASGYDNVVRVARIAGQFAKPRSSDTEKVGDLVLPTYRGDIVNGPEADAASRTPDPMRMLEAHRQSKVTVDLLHAYAAAAYADMSDFHRKARQRLGLCFDHAALSGDLARPVHVYTSHEALLLNYEQALVRLDAASGKHWSVSAHMLWLGDRTRQLDGAHVEFASGIANSIGLKCGPSLTAEDLLRLIERLDPENRPGRLVLIGRFGARKAAEHLPALMRATREAGSNAIWTIDPMHGNTTATVSGKKTRLVRDILKEISTFFEVARSEGVHPGGVHLELTGAPVTECLGGTRPLVEDDLERNYLTHCDPRLNQAQALDVAAETARLILDGAEASDAA
jgi:3-deoxy-7-phosphoheptulonate synthase